MQQVKPSNQVYLSKKNLDEFDDKMDIEYDVEEQSSQISTDSERKILSATVQQDLQSKETAKKLDFEGYLPQVIDLESLANGDAESIIYMKSYLQRQGWFFVQLPVDLQKSVQRMYASSKQYFESEKQEAKKLHFSAPNYGYQCTKNKEAFTVLTAELLEEQALDYLLPQEFQMKENVVDVSQRMDSICRQILQQTYKSVYNLEGERQLSSIPLISDFVQLNSTQPQSSENKNSMISYQMKKQSKTFGMLDIVRYYNDAPYAVQEHIDPGLFSISLFSDEEGLELKDENGIWQPIPHSQQPIGVLWNGLKAMESKKANLKGGWHRVKYAKGKLRITTWYEVCANTQVTYAITNGGMLALKGQNEHYLKQMEKTEEIMNSQDNENAITILVNTQNQQILSFICDGKKDTVGILKRKVEDKIGLRMSKMILEIALKSGDDVLDDAQLLSSYDIQSGTLIECIKGAPQIIRKIKEKSNKDKTSNNQSVNK